MRGMFGRKVCESDSVSFDAIYARGICARMGHFTDLQQLLSLLELLVFFFVLVFVRGIFRTGSLECRSKKYHERSRIRDMQDLEHDRVLHLTDIFEKKDIAILCLANDCFDVSDVSNIFSVCKSWPTEEVKEIIWEKFCQDCLPSPMNNYWKFIPVNFRKEKQERWCTFFKNAMDAYNKTGEYEVNTFRSLRRRTDAVNRLFRAVDSIGWLQDSLNTKPFVFGCAVHCFDLYMYCMHHSGNPVRYDLDVILAVLVAMRCTLQESNFWGYIDLDFIPKKKFEDIYHCFIASRRVNPWSVAEEVGSVLNQSRRIDPCENPSLFYVMLEIFEEVLSSNIEIMDTCCEIFPFVIQSDVLFKYSIANVASVMTSVAIYFHTGHTNWFSSGNGRESDMRNKCANHVLSVLFENRSFFSDYFYKKCLFESKEPVFRDWVWTCRHKERCNVEYHDGRRSLCWLCRIDFLHNQDFLKVHDLGPRET